MDHSFNRSALDEAKCGRCGYDFVSHTPLAQCEVCNRRSTCDLLQVTTERAMLLCKSCYDKERAALAAADEQAAKLRQDTHNAAITAIDTLKPSEALNRLAKKLETTQFEMMGDYFNAETLQITDVEKAVMADDSIPSDRKHFELHRRISLMHNNMKVVLMGAVQLQAEAMSRMRAHQVYLNNLVSELRPKEREELKVKDISYQPNISIAPPKPKKITAKMSPYERLVNDMMASTGQPKEIVMKMLNDNLAAAGVKCSCAATPGLCQMHNR